MTHKTRAPIYLTAPAVLAVCSLLFTTQAHAADEGTVENPDTASVSEAEDLDLETTDAEFEAAVDFALGQVDDPVEEPEAFEVAMAEYVENEVDSGTDSGDAGTMAAPVVIPIYFAGCAAGAYSSLASINPNSSQSHINMSIANAVVSCVGGGVAASTIARWIANNPRTVGIALNAIGLSSLTSSEAQVSAAVAPNQLPERFLAA